jgi:FMN hydrolase / 5-amino-6-(5-phospho-D-ribitylamino)uracil phosphatase
MEPPEILALDIMDTVVRDPFFSRVPNLLGQPIERLRQVFDSASWISFETGLIDEERYLAQMFGPSISPPPISSVAVRQAIWDGYVFLDGMEELLGELARREPPLWALSNYSSWFEVVRQRLSLDRFFSGYVVSYQVGARKPDPMAYHALCRRAKAQPARVLLVDDRKENVRGAQESGMQGLRFRDAKTLRNDLRAQNLL